MSRNIYVRPVGDLAIGNGMYVVPTGKGISDSVDQDFGYGYDDSDYLVHQYMSGNPTGYVQVVLTAPALLLGERMTYWTPLLRCLAGQTGSGNFLNYLGKHNGAAIISYYGGSSQINISSSIQSVWTWVTGPTQSIYVPTADRTALATYLQGTVSSILMYVSEMRMVIGVDSAPTAPAIQSPVHQSVQGSSVTFNWTHSDPEGTSERGWRVTIWNDYAVTGGQEYGAPKAGSFTGYADPYNPPYYGPLDTSQAYYDTGMIVGPHSGGFTVSNIPPGNYWAYISTSDGIAGLGFANNINSHGKASLVYFTVFGANQSSIV